MKYNDTIENLLNSSITKVCPDCKADLPMRRYNFRKSKSGSAYPYAYCKTCNNRRKEKTIIKNKETSGRSKLARSRRYWRKISENLTDTYVRDLIDKNVVKIPLSPELIEIKRQKVIILRLCK